MLKTKNLYITCTTKQMYLTVARMKYKQRGVYLQCCDAPAGKAKYDTTFLAMICLQVFRVIPVHMRYPMVPAMPEWNRHATSYATPCKIFLV